MMQQFSKLVCGGLIMLLTATGFAETIKTLPTIKLTDAAITQAKSMLSEERDSRAVLALIKGNFEVLDRSGNVEDKRSGWMLRIVNREQFPDEPRQRINGLEILFPQQHLYSELEGGTLDFSNSWWVLIKRK
jgi:hypothetical protein